MPQSKILVDTNSYLRLAKTIHPLLGEPFGADEYCLYILPELNQELESPKLQSKFPWIEDDEYTENRARFPSIGRKQKKAIEQSYGYVWSHVLTELPGPSRVDAWYIAYALELGIPLVTDDQDMTELATTFDVSVLSTLELLQIMLNCGWTDMSTIDAIVGYWAYLSDRPANFESDFKRLFGTKQTKSTEQA